MNKWEKKELDRFLKNSEELMKESRGDNALYNWYKGVVYALKEVKSGYFGLSGFLPTEKRKKEVGE